MVNGDLLLGLRPVDTARASGRFDPATAAAWTASSAARSPTGC